MLAGDPTAGYIYFDYAPIDPNAGGMLPTDLDGLTPPPAGTPNLFMEFRADEFGDPADASASTSSTPTSPRRPARPSRRGRISSSPPFDARRRAGRGDIEQPPPASAADYLDSIADRMMFRLAYRSFRDGVQSLRRQLDGQRQRREPHGGATYQAGVRFTELRRDAVDGRTSIQNQVTYAPGSGNGTTGRNLWMGSAAQDNQGNSALGFSASSTTLVPVADLGGAPGGRPGRHARPGRGDVFAGTGAQTELRASRWGDYSAMTRGSVRRLHVLLHAGVLRVDGSFDWAHAHRQVRVSRAALPRPAGTLSGTVTLCGERRSRSPERSCRSGGYLRVDRRGRPLRDGPAAGHLHVTITKPGYTSPAAPAVVTNGGT